MRVDAKTILTCLCLALAPPSAAAPIAAGTPVTGPANATVLIIRHAEKPAFGAGLTPAGEARARGYVGYFRRLRLEGRPVRLDRLVAAAPRPDSDRSRLTLLPLADALRLPIEDGFDGDDIAGVVGWITGHAAGRTVLVAWHHGAIPALVAALGGAPARLLPHGRWPGSVYDEMIVLHFDGRGRVEPERAALLREDIPT